MSKWEEAQARSREAADKMKRLRNEMKAITDKPSLTEGDEQRLKRLQLGFEKVDGIFQTAQAEQREALMEGVADGTFKLESPDLFKGSEKVPQSLVITQ